MTTKMASLPITPGDLTASLKKERVHLFVGSGVSSSAKLTSWDNLIGEMTTVIRTESSTFSLDELEAFFAEADHLDIADVYRSTVQDHQYFSFLRSHYRRKVGLSKLHRAIAAIPVNTVFTTNYDKLLETAFRKDNGSDPAVVIFPEQLGYIDDQELRIIKLHGDIDHPSTICCDHPP